jgi:hypothetical protein
MDNVNELSCMTVIKVIGAIDQPASTLGADRRNDLLSIVI